MARDDGINLLQQSTPGFVTPEMAAQLQEAGMGGGELKKLLEKRESQMRFSPIFAARARSRSI